MLIDSSYFTKGYRHIKNATLGSLPNANAVEANEVIEAYISDNQESFLIKMVGYELGTKLHEYIEQNPEYALLRRVDNCMSRNIGSSEPEDLRASENNLSRENKDYDEILSKLCDSFADYVFFHFIRDINSEASITGLVRLKSANEYVSPIRKQVNVWNIMVERNRLFFEWCKSSECKITGIVTSDDMRTRINVLNL